MSETAIVTGGAGFIGSHLCESLISRGFKVICVDNLITGGKRNVAHLLKNKKFKFLNHDITKPLKINGKVEFLYNLACPASPVDYSNLPIETMLVSSFGVHNALELARKKGAKFLQASTSEVYGDPLAHPQNEDYWGNVNPIGSRSCYDEGKRFAEALATAYRRIYGLDTKIVRIFNTYGPRMRANDGRVMPNFIMQALAGKPITVYGKGSQTRSFCYVSDLVEGLQLAMESKYALPLNLGNPDEITILQLAERIIDFTKSSSTIVFEPLPADDPAKRKPDIGRAREVLKWNPKTPLEEGLVPTVEYFKGEL